MGVTRIDQRTFLEFWYVIGRDEKRFYARAFDQNKKTVAGPVAGDTHEEVEDRIREELKAISTRYYSPAEAVRKFSTIFPNGFRDETYISFERDYKWRAHLFAEEHLSEEKFNKMHDLEICTAISRAYSKPSSPFLHVTELACVSEACKDVKRAEALVERTHDLLHGSDFPRAFARFVEHMAIYDGAKWTIASYLPYIFSPERHFFVKPTIIQSVAEKIGFELKYDPRPSAEGYELILKLADELRAAASSLDPRDNIDIQSLMWLIEERGLEEEVAKFRASRRSSFS